MGFAEEIGMVEMRKRKRNIKKEVRDKTCMVDWSLCWIL